jgi:polyhydroxyalkanoate synthesis regulator phasin
MDLIGMVVGLPLLPFRGLGALLELLRDRAERELYDPTELRKQAEGIDALVASGEITPDEAEQRQEQMLMRLRIAPGKSTQD